MKKIKADNRKQLLDDQPEKLSLKVTIKPKTPNQQKYVKSIETNEITICTGPAGTGKTALAIYAACAALVKDQIERIIITRPIVNCGNGLGYLKGGLEEKFDPYCMPMIEFFEDTLGKDVFNKLVKERIIDIIPLELLRGKNFHHSYVIGDEMQNASYQQIVMLLTRHGQGTKTILTGDLKQTDLRSNDFYYVIKRLEDLKDVGLTKLDRSDIQRSGIIATILDRLEDDGPVQNNWNTY